MKILKKYMLILCAIVLAGAGLYASLPKSKKTSPEVPIQSYYNMLNEIIKEQQEIIKQVTAGQNQVALDTAFFGLKGQSTFLMRQKIKQK